MPDEGEHVTILRCANARCERQRTGMRSARRRKRLLGRVNRGWLCLLFRGVERGCAEYEVPAYPSRIYMRISISFSSAPHVWQSNIDANLAFISNCCPTICVFTTIKLVLKPRKRSSKVNCKLRLGNFVFPDERMLSWYFSRDSISQSSYLLTHFLSLSLSPLLLSFVKNFMFSINYRNTILIFSSLWS